MDRIYRSNALERDDEDPFSPVERGSRHESVKEKVARYRRDRAALDWGLASHALTPIAVRDRAIDVDVTTKFDTYSQREPVDIRVTIRNRLPIPIAIRTVSPVRWQWSVDGDTEASSLRPFEPEGEPRLFKFYRGEQKRFERTWSQMFRTGDSEWQEAQPGEYEIAAWINVDTPDTRGLRSTTTVTLD